MKTAVERTRFLFSLLVFLLAATLVFPGSSPARDTTPRALQDINFGDSRARVYSKVFANKSIRYVNPRIPGAFNDFGFGSDQFPNPRSIFLVQFHEDIFELQFEFCFEDVLCHIELRGASYNEGLFETAIRDQHDFLVSLIQFHYGSPSRTHEVRPGQIKRKEVPAWTHVWRQGPGKPVIKIGYQWNNRMVEDGLNKNIAFNEQKHFNTHKGFFTVLWKEIPERELLVAR